MPPQIIDMLWGGGDVDGGGDDDVVGGEDDGEVTIWWVGAA